MIDIHSLFAKKAAEPSDINEFLPFLRDFVNEHGVKVVVEFGVRDGNSTVAFLASNCEHLISVDIARDPRIAEVEDAYNQTLGLESLWFNFLDNTLEFPPIACDLWFIDDDHTSRHLEKLFAKHAAGVRRYIILHDTTAFWHEDKFRLDANGKPMEGIGRAIIEFLADHPEWKVIEKFEQGMGMMVLAKEGA